MILTLAAATIIATVTVDPVCVWNDRGLHRVTVPVSSLVDNYVDIPPETRARLKQRIDRYQYDEMAVISRDGIKSDLFTYSGMQYMHFGTGKRVCGEVKTDHWAPGDIERAMIFCDGAYCLAVPTVCSNLARVTRRDPPRREMTLLIPPIEAPGGIGAPIESPRMALAFVDPRPVQPPSFDLAAEFEFPPTAPQDRYERIRAELSFYEYWAWRPLFGPVARFAVVPDPFVPPPLFPPVPGVMPAPPAVSTNPPVLAPPGVPVAAAAVPELSTWGLMALGLAGVGFMVRRKGK